MLLNNFFKLNNIEISSDRSSAIANATLNPQHSIFEGHFPENPVVPGVCMIQMIKEILSEIFKKELMLVKSSSIKMNNLIDPLQNRIINFELKTRSVDENNIHVSSKIYFESIKFCIFKGDFRFI